MSISTRSRDRPVSPSGLGTHSALRSVDRPRKALLAGLHRIYGAERLLTDDAPLAAYQSDALTAFEARPLAVVLPDRPDEVIATVRLCHRLGVPFVARGSGTSLSGGSLPIEGGVVIALNRLDHILSLDPAARTIVVEPGVWNLEVSRIAGEHGLLYAPDPSSQQICSIGGNVAFNSGGAHCLKYGMTANHVLAIKVVLPDGEVVQIGGESLAAAASGPPRPDSASRASLEHVGPNWTGLFVGSEGLFGIALEITLRLVPKPERYHTVLAAYHSLGAAGDAVSRLVASGLPPGAIEMMDRLAMDAAEAAVHAGYPPDAAAALIVELEGPAEEVEAEIPRLDAVIEASGAFRTQVAHDAAERAAIWKGRKSAFSAVGRLSPDYIVQDGVVPRSKLGAALAEIERLSESYGLRVANVFHAGDGNLHPLILYEGRETGALERAEALAGEILRLCIRLEGSITGEHGVGMEKRAYLSEMFAPADVETMRRLQRAIDPDGISNPGKMLEPAPNEAPVRADRATTAAAVAHPPDMDGSLRPTSLAELAEAVRSAPCVLARGSGTKRALSAPRDGVTPIEMLGLTGIVDYDPEEFTITALAGTLLAELETSLAEHGQYLPFDPPLVRAGATVGGAIAAGLSGSGRWRYGGLRDFVLQVRYVDGYGTLVRGGAKVVKNAAGFELPRLMAGSLGRLGVLGEATFKVLPSAEARATVRIEHETLEGAMAAMGRLAVAPLELEALDLEPLPIPIVWARVGGIAEALQRRLARVIGVAEDDGSSVRHDMLDADAEHRLWADAREFAWVPDGWALLDVPLAPANVPALEGALGGLDARRRYCAGGNLGLLACRLHDLPGLEERLSACGLGALRVWGPTGASLVGVREHAFGARVKAALDPLGRFPEH